MLSRLLLLSLVSITLFANAQEAKLLPVPVGNEWGYINEKGKMVIAPQYAEADYFHAGLAVVRKGGYFGFIDEQGEMVIPAQYEYARAFEHEMAVVHRDGMWQAINKQGQSVFDLRFGEIDDFTKEGYSRIKTSNGNAGLINRNGELVLDTVYLDIGRFMNSCAFVSRRPEKGDSYSEFALINTELKEQVPFGTYRQHKYFKDGYAMVSLDSIDPVTETFAQGIIDSLGKLRYIIDSRQFHFDYAQRNYSYNRTVVNWHDIDLDTIREFKSHYRNKSYKALLNENGKRVSYMDDWVKITPIVNNRGFAQNKRRQWCLIDGEGQVKSRNRFKAILKNDQPQSSLFFFRNDREFALLNDQWVWVDSFGSVKFGHSLQDFEADDYSRQGDLLVFWKYRDRERFYGFWNPEKMAFQKAELKYLNLEMLWKEGVALCLINERWSYVTDEGKVLWQADPIKPDLRPYDITYMTRGYAYVHSPDKAEFNSLGGFGGSHNNFKPIQQKSWSQKKSLYLRLGEADTFGKSYLGRKIQIVNASDQEYRFEAQDSRLYLVVQAKDENGQWRDIEYLPGSWCGNSYHKVFLPKDHYWELTIPEYAGNYKTELRIKLWKVNSDKEDDAVTYSETFTGGINPGQFWRKLEYHPSGIMDPYVD